MRANESWSSFLFNSHVELTLLFGALVVGLAVGDYRNNMLFPESVTFAKKTTATLKQFMAQARLEGQRAVDSIDDLVSLERELDRQFAAAG
jgi:hypothetical protein